MDKMIIKNRISNDLHEKLFSKKHCLTNLIRQCDDKLLKQLDEVFRLHLYNRVNFVRTSIDDFKDNPNS